MKLEALISFGIALGTVLTGLTPVGAFALSPEETRHFMARTSFAATPRDLETFAKIDRKGATERVIETINLAPEATLPYPAFLKSIRPTLEEYDNPRKRGLDETQVEAFKKQRYQENQQIRAWWLSEMIASEVPLRERMALFWHGHFTSTAGEARLPEVMWQQIQLLRQNATGNFASLLRAVSRDPAMLRYLNGASSKKEQPNENFARELFELFTLGTGNYTEDDIKEAAKAMVGWRVNRDTQTVSFQAKEAVPGDKQVLGKTVQDMDGVIDAVLAHPATAPFIVRKLWVEFISPTPDEKEVERLATLFRDGNWEIAPLLSAMFQSGAFWSETNRGTLVKSPVDLMVGAARGLDIPVDKPLQVVNMTRQMGHELLNPPTVKGWPQGMGWLTSDTLLARRDALVRLAKGDFSYPYPRNVPVTAGYRGLSRYLEDDPGRADQARLQKTLLAAPPTQPFDGVGPGDRVLQAMLDPAYEVK
ncbi:DUF1800 family protein [Lacibacterium aquatile]|uniref:DUF1800 family protein n=1 Tax=Lacibacterium aquatile TaxID=1168082 RepID=A0ABW5DVF1_9PROT